MSKFNLDPGGESFILWLSLSGYDESKIEQQIFGSKILYYIYSPLLRRNITFDSSGRIYPGDIWIDRKMGSNSRAWACGKDWAHWSSADVSLFLKYPPGHANIGDLFPHIRPIKNKTLQIRGEFRLVKA